MDNTENKNKRYKVLIPKKASPLIALGAVVVAIFLYLMIVPFNLSFVSGGSEVYRQESVGVLTDIGYSALDDAGSSGWKKVYGENKLSFSAEDGEDQVRFEKNYGSVKKLMMKTALKNLFTFAWSEEDFTIEFTAR